MLAQIFVQKNKIGNYPKYHHNFQMKYQDKLIEAESKVKDIVAQIAKLIESCPDNTKIERTGNSFLIRVKDLSKNFNLSPDYYDFKYQYKLISEYLQKNSNSIAINKILNDKKILVDGSYITLHPEVFENVKKIFS